MLAPEGFMGAPHLSRPNYLLYEVEKGSACSTFKGMNNPLLPISLRKPQRYNRPELERFSIEIKKSINGMALMFWEYILRNDARVDQLEEELRRKR